MILELSACAVGLADLPIAVNEQMPKIGQTVVHFSSPFPSLEQRHTLSPWLLRVEGMFSAPPR